MPRTLQRGQLRRKKITHAVNRNSKENAQQTPWLTPFRGLLIFLAVVAGLIHYAEVPSVSIQVRTESESKAVNAEQAQAGNPQKKEKQKEDSSSSQSNSKDENEEIKLAPQNADPKNEETTIEDEHNNNQGQSDILSGPLLTDAVADPWKRTLYRKLDRIREGCGELCAINDMDTYKAIASPPHEGTQFSTFQIPVDCQNLFELNELDEGDKALPFPIPAELEPFFSMNGVIPVQNVKRYKGDMDMPKIDVSKFNVKFGGRGTHMWSLDELDRGVSLLMHGELKGENGVEETNRVFDKIKTQGGLKDKTVLIVGSESSWLPTIALAAGASHIVIVEYLPIKCMHPHIKTMTPDRFRNEYLEGKLPLFDAVLAYSSLDHTGLGRYGEILNPWGDITTLARCWCATRDDGMLILALPTGPDELKYNEHRIYGNLRWPLVTANWLPLDQFTDYTQNEAGKTDAIHFFRKVSQD